VEGPLLVGGLGPGPPAPPPLKSGPGPRPTGGTYIAPADPLAGLRVGPTGNGKEGGRGKEGG